MKKKEVLSWAMYDWANSAFSTTVMAGFFPVFFKNYWSEGTDPTLTTARLGTAISLSGLIIALISPTLGAMADLHGYKKIFNFMFMCLGAVSCFFMGFLNHGQWQYAIILYGLAMMGFNASAVFYDALLPEVAKGRDMDFASSLGYSLGYLGGGILFLINVIMFQKPDWFGLPDGVAAVKVSFIMVAFWWFLFTLPLQLNVHEIRMNHIGKSLWDKTSESLMTLKQTILDLRGNKNLLIYMVSYWLFIDGVYTVMTMAVDFGINIGLESKDLIAALLLTQFIGFPFAWLFGRVTPRWGCRKPILFCIAIYTLTVIFSVFMEQAWHFYLLAAVIGMVQGGVQSLSRSLFGQMIPVKSSGEYFGLFNLVGRFASILGPFFVGVGTHLMGNVRLGLLSLLILFVVGGGLLFQVHEPDAA